jgi:hypothetical protein
MKSSSALFISKEGLATFWFLLAAGAVLGAGFYVHRLINKTALRPQYIIMTNADVKPLTFELDPAKVEVRDRDQTMLLLDSVFNKSPSGLDAADRCRRMMSDTAWKWVQAELLDKQNDAFRDGQMHQKIEVEKIDLRELPNNGTLATMSGQLLRTGIHEGRLFNEVWSVKADILWLPNTSLLEHGRIPIICHRFTCRETPVASTIRRTQEGAPPLPPSTSTPAPDAAPN